MAKTSKFLSLTDMPQDTKHSNAAVQCELIVGFHASSTLLNASRHQYPTHTHPFLQLEIVQESRTLAVTPTKSETLIPGDCLLIPPDVSHRFVYEDLPVRWASFRFSATGVSRPNRAYKLQMTSFNTCVRDAILHAMPGSLTAPDSPDGHAVASLLAALLQRNCPEDRLAVPGVMESRFVRDILAFIQRHAKTRISLHVLAQHCGYAQNYLAKKFKRETGTGLKEFMDQKRCRMAENLLAHTHLSVSEVAYDMGFKNIYGFSRFFKRVNGNSPKDYRVGFLLDASKALTSHWQRRD